MTSPHDSPASSVCHHRGRRLMITGRVGRSRLNDPTRWWAGLASSPPAPPIAAAILRRRRLRPRPRAARRRLRRRRAAVPARLCGRTGGGRRCGAGLLGTTRLCFRPSVCASCASGRHAVRLDPRLTRLTRPSASRDSRVSRSRLTRPRASRSLPSASRGGAVRRGAAAKAAAAQ